MAPTESLIFAFLYVQAGSLESKAGAEDMGTMQRISLPVFLTAAGLVAVFVAMAVLFTEPLARNVEALQGAIVANFGWFYVFMVGAFLVFVLWLLISPYGRIRLGRDDELPEFSFPTWFAMLFSAGMGIGLLFYGVAEPILHFANPRIGEGRSIEAAQDAMTLTFLHWGLHAWSIYIVVGLSLGFFAYRHGLPLTIRSALYPLLGRHIHGWAGHAVDIFAIFGTLFGIATSLGLGVMQINAGFGYLGLLDVSLTNQLILIAVITVIATGSAASGLGRGIRRLSELNMLAGLVLLTFVFLLGPTSFLLSTLVESVGRYVWSLPYLSFRTLPYAGLEWQASWTMFYWGWWISWAPFVGMFIARVSRGRTIREFIGGVLLAPVLLTFLWFVVFGETAIHMELFGVGGVAEAVAESVPTALFVMLDRLPLSMVTSAIATVMVITFFVTSADSGALVIDIIASGGNPEPPVATRIFWALLAGTVAGVLLVVGGLNALQTAAITTALPFAVIMGMMCVSLVKGLRAERMAPHPHQLQALGAADLAGADGGVAGPGAGGFEPAANWRQRLAIIVGRRTETRGIEAVEQAKIRAALEAFMADVVHTAFRQIGTELGHHGRRAVIEASPLRAVLIVYRNGDEEFFYRVHGRVFRPMTFAFPEMETERVWYPRAEVMVRGGVHRAFDPGKTRTEDVVEDFIAEYGKWLGW